MLGDRMKKRLNRLLDEAEEAADREDWAKVGRVARQALLIDAGNSDASDFLRLAERGIAETDAAVTAPLRAETASPPPHRESIQQPTSFANGRYQIREFLGEGGRKRVYKARDTVLDRDVALAVIKTEGLDPTSRVRITREAQAMGRLGDHPHVLSIHDLGEDNGQPYMVLPLMPGGDVGTLLESAEDHRLPLDQSINLAMQVCRGLEFAHSKGIIHRDLKPGNVWLASDGTAKIGDFGLAVAIDRSRLTQEGMMVGTVSYMPPEQAMGGDVTPQSDLYSLGAMLYEMVCGRPPFLGDDSVAIIGQHINTAPVAPTWHRQECPRALEALIMRLLAKDPGERPNSATDAITALEGLDLIVSSDEPVAERDQAHALDSLAGGVFVGRQKEMGELKAALEDALSGRGRLVTLVGEPGIGKTRTSEELATYARMRGAQVLWGRCYEEQGVPPYWPWVQAIRSYVREHDPDELMSEMGAGAADIAEIVSDVKAKLPGLPAPPLLDSPEQARFRLFDSVTAFLRTAGQRQLLVIVLDDLHWADQPSLMLLQFITREIANARVLVLGTYRDVELSRQHPLAETLGDLTRERLFTRVLLRGLTRSDVERFIEIASGVAPPAGLVSAVHVQTEGNPLFVTEVVRLLVQEGDLTPERATSRDSWTVRIPEGVREVIGRRLNRLSNRCNDVLTTAAVIGREFELRQLNAVIDDLTQDMLLDVLEEGLAGRVVEELPTSAGRYQFTHAMIQETLLEELSLTRRVRLHALVADKLEELYGDEAHSHAAQLANHYAQSETVQGTDKLVKYSIIAGESSLGSYANEEALQHFTRAWSAIQGGELDDTSARVLYGLGRAQAVTSELFKVGPAISNLTGAFNYYRETADVSRAALIAQLAHSTEIITGLAEVIRDALELVPPDTVEYGRILANHGYVLGATGDYESCQRAFEDAMVIAQRAGDRSLEARVLANRGNIDGFHFRMDDCLEKCLRAIELLEPNDYSSARLRARLWAGTALIALGRPSEASRHHDDLRAAAGRLRDRIWISRSTDANIVDALAIGDWQGISEGTEAVLAASEGDFWAICLSAYSAHLRGDRDELRLRLDQAGADVRSTGQDFISSLRHVRGLTTLAMIPDAEHDESLMSAVADWAESGDSVARHSQYRNLARAFLAVRYGDKEKALELFHEMLPFKGTLSRNSTSADRVLGLLATVFDDNEQAAAHFDDSLDFCRKAGYRPELAWTCSQYADLLLDPSTGSGRAAEENRHKAMSLLDEALATASDLGMAPLVDQVLSRKMSLQGIDITSRENSIEAVVSAVEVERPNLQPHAAPDGTVTVMFTDIEGSTAMTERLGDQRAQDVLRIHNAIIREQVAAHQGFEVKSEGDGFMLAFSSARRALECAIAIQQALTAYNAENPSEPIRVRIGLHTGEAIKEGEDFFGKTVILGARIASQAVGGEILVSSLLKALVESSGEFEFGQGRDLELKGLAGTHQVFEISLP